MNLRSTQVLSGWRPVSVTLLAASLPCFVTCGGGGDSSSGTDTSSVVANLQRCGLVSSGRGPQVPEGEYYSCYVQCLSTLQDCDALNAEVCGSGSAVVADCVRSCFAFQCGDGTGVPDEDICDGYDDCPNGADEANCDPSLFFDCLNGNKVLAEERCDGQPDCPDSSDEAGCTELNVFTCADGTTIPGSYECDGEADCAYYDYVDGGYGYSADSDLSDEQNCGKKQFFQCNDGSLVSLYYECDGEMDCQDGSDEHADCAKYLCK